MEQGILRRLGRTSFPYRYFGWIGVDYASEDMAVWLMRAMIVENVLARREGTVLFLPVNHRQDATSYNAQLLGTLDRIERLHEVSRVLRGLSK
jgi:hypothetical protein